MIITALANLFYGLWILADNFIGLMAALCTIDEVMGWDLVPDSVCDAIPEE